MLVMPPAIYVLSPPQLKATPDAVGYARAEMAKMGPVSPKEMVMPVSRLRIRTPGVPM